MSKKESTSKRRSSLPAPMQGSQQMWPAPMWNPATFMNPYGMGMMPPPMAAAMTNKESAAKNPWESSSESDSDDFQPRKKPTKASKAPAASTSTGEKKRGRGRPPKKEAAETTHEDLAIIESYPSLNGKDEIAFLSKDECKQCRLWKGRIALRPCGHGMYCYSCVQKLKSDASTMKRAAKCLRDNCYSVTKSWMVLYNISA